ncbi:3174_t:CDS:2 [Gigaspora margarita]|uniref:DNA-directed RNA polymerase subunit n=2 Tax=Gigaspora margarita TaxID=4874 RepID=A0A8H3X899_GIGMA|nr:putative Rpc11-DNA-directed RNA polymerase III subunit C11 [Gigaspora margarita]CAG8829851.1 3174_t:CDS:2 [Gigaspora margarita]
MLFCPCCGNLLLIKTLTQGEQAFYCQTCPYIFPIGGRGGKSLYKNRTTLKRKEVDDVLGGEEGWKNVDSTEARCPKCEHPRAYFMQIQTRSADEPMSIFYKCCNHDCQHQWNEK